MGGEFSYVMADANVNAAFDINVYQVLFKDYNDSILKIEHVAHGSSATAPADPVRDGYNFTGWLGEFSSITSDFEVKAQYEIKQYDVKFVSEGVTLQQGLVAHGSDAVAPADPVKVGHRFMGWDCDFTRVTAALEVNAVGEIVGVIGGPPCQSWSERDL